MTRNWQTNLILTVGSLLLLVGLISAVTQAAACVIMTIVDVAAILVLVAGVLTIPVMAVLWAIDAVRGTTYTARYMFAVRHTVQAIGRQGARVPTRLLHRVPDQPTITVVDPTKDRMPRVIHGDGTLD